MPIMMGSTLPFPARPCKQVAVQSAGLMRSEGLGYFLELRASALSIYFFFLDLERISVQVAGYLFTCLQHSICVGEGDGSG